MTEARLLSVAFKFLGVWCLIRALEHFPMVFTTLFNWEPSFITESIFLGSFIAMVLLLASAYVLVRKSDSFSAKFYNNSGGEEPIPLEGSPGRGWEVLAFTVLGVVLILWNTPQHISQLAGNLVIVYTQETIDGTFDVKSRAMHGAWILGIQIVMQLLIGLYLILGSRGLARVIGYYRTRE